MSQTHCPCGKRLTAKQIARDGIVCSQACKKLYASRPRRFWHRDESKVSIRICLACDRPFPSEGPWNRICPRCGPRLQSVRDPVHVAIGKQIRTSRKNTCVPFA